MEDDSNKETKGLLSQAYKDLIHPSAIEVGNIVKRAVNISLSPASGLLWTVEQSLLWLENEVTKRFIAKKMNPADIKPPPPAVLGPIVIGLQGFGEEKVLAELFANLLETSMDVHSSQFAHPAYAELIRQLLPDEARLLSEFAPKSIMRFEIAYPLKLEYEFDKTTGMFIIQNLETSCENPKLIDMYIDNLSRLGFILRKTKAYTITNNDKLGILGNINKSILLNEKGRNALENKIDSQIQRKDNDNGQTYVTLDYVELTKFGALFLRACFNIRYPDQDNPPDYSDFYS